MNLERKILPLSLFYLEEVIKIEKALHPQTSWSRKVFCEILNRGEYFSFVLLLSKEIQRKDQRKDKRKVKKEVVGFFCTKVFFEKAEILLLNLGVKTEFQNCGYGSELLDFLIRESRRASFRKIFLQVDRKNLPALRLYQSRKFKSVSSSNKETFIKKSLDLLGAKSVFS